MSDSAGLNAGFVGSIYSDIHVTVEHAPERHSTYAWSTRAALIAGLLQSQFWWGFGGGFAAPEEYFGRFWAAKPPRTDQIWGVGHSSMDFAIALPGYTRYLRSWQIFR